MPKSRRRGAPSGCTRMFDGLRSRWTTRRPCANCTALTMRRKSARRSSSESACCAQYVVTGTPSTNSRTMYGRPSSSAPPSRIVAMPG